MPGHAGSPYWAAVDFDSEGEENNTSPQPNQRIYLDPWENETYGMVQTEPDSLQGDNFNSFAGEPVSASFYYVPTKNYDSEEEAPIKGNTIMPMLPHPDQVASQEYALYGRKVSRPMVPVDYHPDPIYNGGDRMIRKYLSINLTRNGLS